MAIKQTTELEKFLQKAFDKGASHLFLQPGEPLVFRIDNEIERDQGEVLSSEIIATIVHDALGEKVANKLGDELGDTITSCSIPGIVDGRMCITKSFGEYTVSIRLLSVTIPSAERVKIKEPLLKAAMSSHGLIIFAGLTGSGKTTSMLSLLDYINKNRQCCISTIENPICCRILPKKSLVQQKEVGSDVPSLVSGVQAAIRQEVDVILIGEPLTAEDVQIAIMAAQTGHLVLTQMHANTPQGVISRLIDIQPEEQRKITRKNLSEVLRAISTQKLLPKKSGRGRTCAYGLIVPDDHMLSAIAKGEELSINERHLSNGNCTLAQDIARLCEEGEISEETKLRAFEELR